VENTGLVQVITTVVKFIALARRVTHVQARHQASAEQVTRPRKD
jgi:hypothetical protein